MSVPDATPSGEGLAPVVYDRAWGASETLREMLRPIQGWLDDPLLTNLNINGTAAAFLHRRGFAKQRVRLPYDADDLHDLAILAASLNRGDDVADDAPFAGGVLPDGHRVQIARPPATADGTVYLSIRRPSPHTPTIADLKRDGVFDGTVGKTLARKGRRRPELLDLHRSGDYAAFLDAALSHGPNVVFAGPQDSGKSYDLRAATTSIAPDVRLCTVEDLPEAIHLRQEDVVALHYSKGGQGTSSHTADDCIAAALRMTTKALVVQEVRDAAAAALLSALLAGVQVVTTTHSNSAAETPDRLRSLVKMHPSHAYRADADVLRDLHATVDVIVYCTNDAGRYRIEQVLYDLGR